MSKRHAGSLLRLGSAGLSCIAPGRRRESHEANFRRVLPKQMDALVQQGLFVRDGDTYKITAQGMLRLKELEPEK